jgi:hypothetical protein
MHRELLDTSQRLPLDRHAMAMSIHLENDLHMSAPRRDHTPASRPHKPSSWHQHTYLLAPENQQVRVFRDDPIDVSLALKKAQLRIRLIGRDHILYILSSQRLSCISARPFPLPITSTHLDKLVRHLGGDIQAFRIIVSGLSRSSLSLESLRTSEMVGP